MDVFLPQSLRDSIKTKRIVGKIIRHNENYAVTNVKLTEDIDIVITHVLTLIIRRLKQYRYT